jgi:hypothetical protein
MIYWAVVLEEAASGLFQDAISATYGKKFV